MKKRILIFYGLLLLLAIILIVVQVIRFNGILGFVIKNDVSTYTESKNLGFEGKIISYGREGNYLVVNYALNDLIGYNNDLKISYEFSNGDGGIEKKGVQNVFLGADSLMNYVLKFELPQNSFGSFDLILNINNYWDNLVLEKSVFLSKDSLTGFAISESNKRSLSIFAIVILGLLIIFMLFRIVVGLLKPERSEVSKGKRHLIKLDIE